MLFVLCLLCLLFFYLLLFIFLRYYQIQDEELQRAGWPSESTDNTAEEKERWEGKGVERGSDCCEEEVGIGLEKKEIDSGIDRWVGRLENKEV